MPQRDSVEEMMRTIAALRGAELDTEEMGEIELWNKGRALAQIVAMPGWTVVLEMLASYVSSAMRAMMQTDPANEAEVKANHAVLYAANRLYNSFVEDAGNAVERARKTPNVVKDGLRKATPAPPDSMF